MQTCGLEKPEGQFLIQPVRQECSSARYRELCESIEHLGGVKTAGGYAFATANKRLVAAEVLGDKFGDRYFRLL